MLHHVVYASLLHFGVESAEQIIASGMASDEFQRGDATLASRLVNTACVRFSHPRLIEEFEQEPEPTSDQIIGFCLTALTKRPV
jgi:hypothetical protein